MASLSNFNITSPVNSDLLIYLNGEWVNSTLNGFFPLLDGRYSTNTHNHNTLYYTKAQVYTKSETYPAASLYTRAEVYTKDEVDVLLGGVGGGGGGAVTGAANVGSGVGVYKALSSGSLQFRTISSANLSLLTVDQVGDDIVLTPTSGISGGSNLAGGSGIFYDVQSNVLRFKSIRGGSGISVDGSNAAYVEIINNSSVTNLGSTGEALATGFSAGTLSLKRLIAGSNITLGVSSSGITINSTAVSGGGDGGDADTLNGYVSNLSDTPNTVAVRDSNARIKVSSIESSLGNVSSISGAMAFRVNNSSNDVLQFCSSTSAIRNWLDVASAVHGHNWSDISGIPAFATRWPSFSEVSGTSGVWTSSNDGQGSGLHADLLDGHHAAEEGTNNIPIRDDSGDLSARSYKSSISDTTTISGAMAYRISSSNKHIRFCSSKSAIRAWLDVLSTTDTISESQLPTYMGVKSFNQVLTGGSGSTYVGTSSSPFSFIYGSSIQATSQLGVYNTNNYMNSSGVFGVEVRVHNTNNYMDNTGVYGIKVRSTSDIKVKTNLEVLTDSLELLHKIKGYSYWRTDLEEQNAGLIANEVQAILPETVGVDQTSNLLNLDINGVVALLVEAVKELTKEVRNG